MQFFGVGFQRCMRHLGKTTISAERPAKEPLAHRLLGFHAITAVKRREKQRLVRRRLAVWIFDIRETNHSGKYTKTVLYGNLSYLERGLRC